MPLSPKYLSMALTVLIGLFVVSVVFNVHLSTKRKLAEQLYELNSEELPKEELAKEETPKETVAKNIRTNRSYNELKKSLQRELDDFKTLDELREEARQNEASQASEEMANDLPSENDSNASGNLAMNTSSKKSARSSGDNTSKLEARNNAANRDSSISYSLVDRTEIGLLPNPTYTCMLSGKVVVNIKVNSYGDVYEATLNEASSTSDRGCHVDNAIAYALRAKFDPDPAKSSQLGTITYYFQGK